MEGNSRPAEADIVADHTGLEVVRSCSTTSAIALKLLGFWAPSSGICGEDKQNVPLRWVLRTALLIILVCRHFGDGIERRWEVSEGVAKRLVRGLRREPWLCWGVF